jgi:hypothetical protein
MVNYVENVQSEAWGSHLIFPGQTHYITQRDEVWHCLCSTTLHISASDADNSYDPLKSQQHVLGPMAMLLRTCNFLHIKRNVYTKLSSFYYKLTKAWGKCQISTCKIWRSHSNAANDASLLECCALSLDVQNLTSSGSGRPRRIKSSLIAWT